MEAGTRPAGEDEATPADALTVVVRLVDSCADARPFASVPTTVADSAPFPVAVPVVPVSMANVTGTPASTLPLVSLTTALMVVVPPVDGSAAGLALTEMAPTAAAPT